MSHWLAVRLERGFLSWNFKPAHPSSSSNSRRSNSPRLIWLLAVRILASRMETLIFQFTNKLIRIFNFQCFYLSSQSSYLMEKQFRKFPKHSPALNKLQQIASQKNSVVAQLLVVMGDNWYKFYQISIKLKCKLSRRRICTFKLHLQVSLSAEWGQRCGWESAEIQTISVGWGGVLLESLRSIDCLLQTL